MMSKRIIYLLFPMMVLGLMTAPALAATPDHLNLENPLALSSQSRMADSCPAATDLPGNAFVLAKGGKSGSSGGSSSSGSGSSGSNSGSSDGNSDGECCDNDPLGRQGPAEDEDSPYRYQYRHTYQYDKSLQNQKQYGYGPGDGEGNDGEDPQDGNGYGALLNR